MAKLTDLPAELVHRTIEYIVQPENDPKGAREAWDGRLIDPDDHHLLDHNGLRGIKPKPRPHHEPTPRTAGNQQATPAASQSPVSWPHGLPSNPLLPMSLVYRTFQKFAQERLFRNVPLWSTRRARLFLQALTSPHDQSTHISGGADINSPDAQADDQQDEAEKGRSSGIDRPRLSRLAQHVRTLQLMCIGPCSMDDGPRGGGGLLCEIVRCCPLLENIAISTTFSIDCREPLLDALASRRLIKEFVVVNINSSGSDRSSFRWSLADLMSRLLPHWDLLETLDVVELVGSCLETNTRLDSVQLPIPILICPLRTLILHQPEIDEKELSMLLKSFRESIQTLEIIGPAHRIGPAAINRVLKESTNPQLECLSLDWSHQAQPLNGVDSDDPDTSLALLDLLFKSPTTLRNLKSLSFIGSVATHHLFERLPDSLVKLAWENCEISPTQFVRILSRDQESEVAVQSAIEARGACFHTALDPDYGEPTLEDEWMEAAEGTDPYLMDSSGPIDQLDVEIDEAFDLGLL